MTEKEKMLSGQLHQPSDAQLTQERLLVQHKLFRLNYVFQSEEDYTHSLRELISHLGDKSRVAPPFRCHYGYNINLGTRSSIDMNCTIVDSAMVMIGNRVRIGPDVGLYTAILPFDAEERATGREIALPILIQDDVWIGGHVTILAGVTIGKGSVIAAGSVVVGNVPPGVFAAGNPCRVMRPLHQPETQTSQSPQDPSAPPHFPGMPPQWDSQK